MNRAMLDAVAADIQRSTFCGLPKPHSEVIFEATYLGYAQPKQRPQFSGRGAAYTPKKTRDYEEAVKTWAMDNYGKRPVFHPVKVTIEIIDPIPSRWGEKMKLLANMQLLFKQQGDIDNKAKAILDAVNGVLFVDDKQISELVIRRRYSGVDGFCLKIERSGFSAVEAEQLVKLLG